MLSFKSIAMIALGDLAQLVMRVVDNDPLLNVATMLDGACRNVVENKVMSAQFPKPKTINVSKMMTISSAKINKKI